MPRNISFALTTDQIRKRTKTVTRRAGWKFLKAGDVLNACVKCMGLKPGESIERLGQITVTDVRREPLEAMVGTPYGDSEAAKEGFPDLTGEEFVEMFCRHMGGDAEQEVTRIEFIYGVQLDVQVGEVKYCSGDTCPTCRREKLEFMSEESGYPDQPDIPASAWCDGCGLDFPIDWEREHHRRMAVSIAHDLFTNGNGDHAGRLVLAMRDGSDGGGWCVEAVIERIATALDRLNLPRIEEVESQRCRRFEEMGELNDVSR